MTIEDNKKLVLDFFEELWVRKSDEWIGMLADDVTYWVQGTVTSGDVKVSGLKNKAEMVELLKWDEDLWHGDLRFTPVGITAEGDRVALEAESDAELKNGKILHNTYHFLFVVQDEKVKSVRLYMDTLHAFEVLSG